MEYVLAPSILAADFKKLGAQMQETEANGARYLHFDVMDGEFVPNISFGMPVLKSIRSATNQIFDVHLMIMEPVRYVEEFAKAGADIITVHYEACQDVGATLEKIRSLGVKAGLSVKPGTPVEAVKEFLPLLDMVLIMSVEPGFGGQKFMPAALERLREIRGMIAAQERPIDLQVDGGVDAGNVRDVLDAGANVIVAGSAVFRGSPAENTRAFMEIFQERLQ
ncbi:MAG TPA: ribulose-phosphate 3-epimerase [Lachnospiraceae bacterium]|nr:ribulose-phosphate 3-epimerase [Lachnospiraceae bacterium]